MTDVKTDSISVARRALDLLAAFDARSRRLTLSEMAARSNLPVPTAYRLVKVLTEWGALERGRDRRYEIGRRVWQLGLLADVQTEIRQIAAPFLQDLYVATREAVYLAVRQGKSALYVDRLTGRIAPKVLAHVGSRLPLYATGVGKVLLAHAPTNVVDEVLTHLRQFTPNTVVDQTKLRRELETVRQRGFAHTLQEFDMSTAAIAVPIVDSEGYVESALGLVTSQLRKDLTRVLPALQVTAQSIGRSLPPHHGDLFT